MSVWKLLSGVAAGLASEIHLPGNGSIIALLKNFSSGYPHADGGVAHNRIAFTIGVIALGAKMAKADGLVTRDEVWALKEVFRVPEGELENVSRIFDLAKQDIAGYEVYAEQLAGLFKHDHRLLEDVLEGLFHIAVADGVLHQNEEHFLAAVAKRFGIADNEFSYIKARHVASTKESPYDILGVTPNISNDALKTHYRRLVVENHPDKMVAPGGAFGVCVNGDQKNRCYQCRLRGRRQRATHLIMDSSAHPNGPSHSLYPSSQTADSSFEPGQRAQRMRMAICRLS